MRGRFLWRVGGIFLLLFLLGIGGCTLIFWLGANLAGWVHSPGGWQGSVQAGGIFGFFLVLAGLLAAALALRRLALPLGDLMEAAGRVAEGDYEARVPDQHGPRELRALSRAFNAMGERLQRNEVQRRNFLADVTHELRTPLTVIQGSLEGMLDGVYPIDEAHLAPALEETRVLARLIDDLRTLSLVETGALKLQREPTDLSVLLNEASASFRPQAGLAQVEIGVEAAPDLPLIEIDPARIREVVTNLLANALRYTPAGGRIQVTALAENGSGPVIVSVRDTGRGIAPEDLAHIFDRFYKSGESRGSGLGLAIARNLIAAHGGEISAASEGGHGTTVRFTLPRAAA